MSIDKTIEQAASWLAAAGDDHDIELLLDLPELEWVTLKKLDERDGLLWITYRGRTMTGYLVGDVEMACERTAIKAVRRIPSIPPSVEDVLG